MDHVNQENASQDVEILLSTYNGARYLDAFLDSIVDQDYGDWRLTIRDDGSSDDTVAVLQRWKRNHPLKIQILDEGKRNNLGVVGSFSTLMQASTAPYIMFADQDDVWLPFKVRISRQAMREREESKGAECPIVVHTDASVVDESLKSEGLSAWRFQGSTRKRPETFARVLVENTVLGCSTLLNRALVNLIGDIPNEAIYHDWWIALVASAFGDIVPLWTETLLWRRHGSNETEMSNTAKTFWRALAQPQAMRRRLGQLLEESGPRVQRFLDRYQDRLGPDQVAAARAFLRLRRTPFIERRIEILRHGLFFVAPLRNVGLLALI